MRMQKRQPMAAAFADVMVGERGFEPPTPWSRTRCSTRLSHSPMVTCVTLVVLGVDTRAEGPDHLG